MQNEYVCSRQDNLVVQPFEAELVVYDLTINKAYCLNQTSAAVWQLCDGRKSVTEISGIMSKQLKTLIPDELVWLAIEQLKGDGLLKKAEDVKIPFEGLNRREIIRKVGLTSMVAFPLITSIVAPTSLAAQSTTCVVGRCYPAAFRICDVCPGQCVDTILYASKDGTCVGRVTIVSTRCDVTIRWDNDQEILRTPCL